MHRATPFNSPLQRRRAAIFGAMLLAAVLNSPAFAAEPSCGASNHSATTRARPHVLIETDYGHIVAEIYVDAAPITARNFLRYVDENRYRDATFYRAVRRDNNKRPSQTTVIQGGIDPTVRHPPLPPIAHESTAQTGLKHVDGTLFMARWEPGTAASEFAILIGDNPAMDFGGGRSGDGQGFAPFGRVISGMDVVRRINAAPTNAPTALEYMQGQALTNSVAMHIERCSVSRPGGR